MIALELRIRACWTAAHHTHFFQFNTVAIFDLSSASFTLLCLCNGYRERLAVCFLVFIPRKVCALMQNTRMLFGQVKLMLVKSQTGPSTLPNFCLKVLVDRYQAAIVTAMHTSLLLGSPTRITVRLSLIFFFEVNCCLFVKCFCGNENGVVGI